MKVVVTGGAGRIGRYIVDELKKFHHNITVFDIVRPEDKSIDFIKGDMLKINDCKKAFKGKEIVIHLAALQNAVKGNPPQKLFNTNIAGVFNVHQAAADLGIKKVVHASSDCSYGFCNPKQLFLPSYLPLDEDHPQKPQDAYGLSKKVGEEIAASFTRRYNMETVAIRIFSAWFPDTPEFPHAYLKIPLIEIKEKPETYKMGFWSYTDVRDVAQVFRLTVDAKGLKKNEVFCISAENNVTNIDTLRLVKKYLSDKILFNKEIKGKQSLVDWSKAKNLLGYRPQYTW